MDIDELAEYIWEHGTYIQCRWYYNQTLQLYAVNRQFFEIWYSNSENEITRIAEINLDEVLKFYYAGS